MKDKNWYIGALKTMQVYSDTGGHNVDLITKYNCFEMFYGILYRVADLNAATLSDLTKSKRVHTKIANMRGKSNLLKLITQLLRLYVHATGDDQKLFSNLYEGIKRRYTKNKCMFPNTLEDSLNLYTEELAKSKKSSVMKVMGITTMEKAIEYSDAIGYKWSYCAGGNEARADDYNSILNSYIVLLRDNTRVIFSEEFKFLYQVVCSIKKEDANIESVLSKIEGMTLDVLWIYLSVHTEDEFVDMVEELRKVDLCMK